MRPPRTIAVVVVEDFQLLDLAGPVDVFRMATRFGVEPAYELVVASPDGAPVRAESGVSIVPDTSVAALARRRGPLDTLLVAGGQGTRTARDDEALLGGLRRASARAERTASVCTGALVLAAAGLLDGYRATTHWQTCDHLARRHPAVTVEAQRLHVHDRDRWTSAGVTAGIDLALAMVEHDHGPEVAHRVARQLVVFVRRPGGQPQFSAQLAAQPARSRGIVAVQRWLPDHLTEDCSVDALAARAAMSPRHFARAFRAETGTTPAAFVEQLRVEAARRLLETSDLTVAAIAERVGLRHGETLHRAFRRQLDTTPDAYRQHFARRPA